MRLFSVILTLGLAGAVSFPPSAMATEFHNGYTLDGYVYRDGYFYRGDKPYAYLTYYDWARDGYGRQYKQLYYYFKAVHVEQPKPDINYKDPNWRARYVDLLRDKQEAEAFDRAMRGLGIRFDDAGDYGAGDRGGTLYKRIKQSEVNVVGPAVDRNILFQQAIKLIERSQNLSGQGFSELRSSIDREGDAQHEETKLLLLRELIEALKQNKATVRVAEQEFRINREKGEPTLELIVGRANRKAAILERRCYECHSGKNVQGTFDATRWNDLGEERQTEIVRDHIMSADPKKHMPFKGPMLPSDEIKELLP